MIKTIEWNGKRISKPGLYSQIPLGVYHSQAICDGPSVSSSGLRVAFSQSLAHFYDSWSGNPDRVVDDEKRHHVLGRAVHHLMLGESYFSKLFCVQPDEYPDAKTGELKKWTYLAQYCKDWRDEQREKGLAILTSSDVEAIRGMANTISDFELVKQGALNGMIERSIFWKDKTTGLWVKARPDAIPTSSADFVDLKTTDSVLWPDMQRSIYDYGYYQQGGLICSAAREVLHIDSPTFTLIFVEKTRPYCVDSVELKPHELDRGERANRMALDAIAKCIKTKYWPGPRGERQTAQYIEMPEYAQKSIDDKLNFGIA